MSNDATICPHCGTQSPEPNEHCPACGATMTPAEARDVDAHAPLPSIYLPVGDHGRLAALARTYLDTRRPVAQFLSDELERAVLCPEIPDGVVTMGSRILFRVDGQDRTECRTLVYPQEYHPSGQYVSILSPVGVALLGLKPGDHMPFRDLQAAPSGVTISEIAYQPGSRRGAGMAEPAAV
jgi:transcription elongation GreA/GreB family factor